MQNGIKFSRVINCVKMQFMLDILETVFGALFVRSGFKECHTCLFCLSP